MITDHFTIITKKDPASDLDEINALLSELSALLIPVCILNYYHELPVTSFSALERFDAGKFEVKVSDMHIQIIGSQMQTILCLDDMNLLAECSSVNVHQGTAVVYGFRFIELHADKRDAFRLNLNIGVELLVNLRNSGGKIHGRMVDISVTGCKVEIGCSHIQVGNMLVLEIKIFSDEKKREVTRSIAATVVHVYQSDESGYCCLEFIGSPSDQDMLAGYLNRMQIAIVRDFRQHKVLPG